MKQKQGYVMEAVEQEQGCDEVETVRVYIFR